MPALKPNKQNVYQQGSGCQPSTQTNETCIGKGEDRCQTNIPLYIFTRAGHSVLVETCDARILLGTVTQPVEWGAPSDPTNYHVLLELYSSHVCRLPSVDRIRCHKPNISMTSANAAIWLVEILTDIEPGRSQIKSREILWHFFWSLMELTMNLWKHIMGGKYIPSIMFIYLAH